MTARKQSTVYFVFILVLLSLVSAPVAQAGFGIKNATVMAINADGTSASQAGSHPYEWTISFEMNRDGEEEPEGGLRSLLVDLPPGLLGNPQSLPRCSGFDFEGLVPQCPDNTQIGVAHFLFPNSLSAFAPVYNLVAPIGSPARLGLSIGNLNGFQEAAVRTGDDYGVSVSDTTLPHLGYLRIAETIWGVPGDPSHDAERGQQALEGGPPVAFTGFPVRSFFTLPTTCGEPPQTTIKVDSLQSPGLFDSKTVVSTDEGGEPVGLDGCNALEFRPTISSQPTTNLADSPAGLNFNLHQPQPPASEAEPGDRQGPGQTALCRNGQWFSEPSEFTFQWLRNGAPIPGATAGAYELQNADQGTALQCEVTANNPAAAGPGHAVSESIAVDPAPEAPLPVAGEAFVSISEETATCEPGAWGGEPSFAFQWLHNGAVVPGRTESTYSIAPGEAPFILQCEVLGTNAAGTVATYSSFGYSEPPLEPELPSPVGIPRLSLTGRPQPLASAILKDVDVTLPAGVTLNASAANGLDACTQSQIGYQPSGGEIHFSESPQSCPDAAKIGSLEVNSPLLDHKLEGAVYVAKPYANPFGSLLAIYLAIEDEQTGIIAKLAGEVTPDPQSGQLTARFKDSPQLPIEDIDLHFFGGPGAALKTPLACGQYTTTSDLTPWSTPEGADATPSDSFATSVAAGGSGACPASEATAPNKPAFSAGTLAPQAGAYSPFLLRLSRNDGSQRLSGLDATLPKGLTGRLAGIPYCSEAQIAVAQSRNHPNQGALEQASPSCPLASEVGTVTVGAGAGIAPLYVGGHAYLAGPYKGAPISLAIITPAVAGPFDLGTVVVRTALYVNSESAQIHAVSDPLPSIIAGIPLDLRSIALKMDRPDFTLNPTSCDPSAITGAALALTGQSAALTSPFQVGGCSALKFKPRLAISLKGGTKRNKYPALKAVVTYPKGSHYANIASAQVTLPHSAFLEQAHIGTICTRVQFAAEACPKASIYGFARAFTPLLDKPVEGPVYLRSSSHELPDLVAALKGQVNVDLVGRVDTGKGGGIRNSFEATPDAPVSKFVLEMKGGKKGLLVNSENICRKPQRALVSYHAHNGDAYQATPLIANDCAKKAKRKHKAKKHHKVRR